MTTDFTSSEPTIRPDGDAPLFAANPVWERSRKKKGLFGARKSATPTAAPMADPAPAGMASDRLAPDGLSADRIAPETRSFAPAESSMILDSPIDRPFAAGTGATMTHSTLAATPPAADPPVSPSERHATTHSKASNAGPSAAVIAGAIAAVALVAVGGWYAMAPRDGVPELAPGQPTTSEIAAAPIVTEQPAEVAAITNTLPSRRIAAPVRSEPRPVVQARTEAPARIRPAASAAETGTNASAATVLPDAPQAYTTLNPSAAPAPVVPAPVAPAPVQAAPAPVPETPPVQAEPAPTPESAPPVG